MIAKITNESTSTNHALAASKAEGQSGSTALTFTVTRSGDTSVSHSAKFAVTGSGAAPSNAADFDGGALPGGTVSFATGQTSQTVTVNVAGDTAVEADESFTVTMSGAQAGVSITTATATGVILDDDTKTWTAASETLTGTAGPDLFYLGGGVDTVFGLAGLDRFRFQPSALGAAATNAATMEDFSRVDAESWTSPSSTRSPAPLPTTPSASSARRRSTVRRASCVGRTRAACA